MEACPQVRRKVSSQQQACQLDMTRSTVVTQLWSPPVTLEPPDPVELGPCSRHCPRPRQPQTLVLVLMPKADRAQGI